MYYAYADISDSIKSSKEIT